MTAQAWLTRRLSPPLAPSRAAADVMARCGSCGRAEPRTAEGAAPAGWFQMTTGAGLLLCPGCLRPHVDRVGREWAASNARFEGSQR